MNSHKQFGTGRLLMGFFCLLAFSLAASENGLILHLPLKKDFQDHSQFKHETTAIGDITFVDDAASFSGDKTWLEVGGINPASGNFTFSMWVKVTGNSQMYGLIAQKASKRRSRWLHLMLRGARQPYLGFYNNDAISPRPITVGRWNHLLFSYDGEYQMIWINGEAACARKASPYLGESGTLRIGKTPGWSNVPSHHFVGSMKDIRIYNRVLTFGEIYRLAGRGEPRRQTSSLAVSGIPDPSSMPVSLDRARDGGIPFLFINGKQLSITGETSQIYEVEATHNLTAPWESLGVITNTLGSFEIEDPDGDRYVQRFYRIKVIGAKGRRPSLARKSK